MVQFYRGGRAYLALSHLARVNNLKLPAGGNFPNRFGKCGLPPWPGKLAFRPTPANQGSNGGPRADDAWRAPVYYCLGRKRR